MKRGHFIVSLGIALLLAVTLTIAGCGGTTTTPSTTAAVTTTTSGGGGGNGSGGGTGGGAGTGSVVATTTTGTISAYQIAVYKDGTRIGSLTLDQLHSLPTVTFTKSTGETELGPTLTSALALLGITDFTNVTVDGYSKGRVATAELILQSSEVTPYTILSFNKQGKTKLAGKSIPENNWIIDVSALRVK